MIYILKTNNRVKGGVELYSELLFKSLSNHFNLEIIKVNTKSRVTIFFEIFWKVVISNQRRVIIHHGGFFEVLVVFFLLILNKKVIIISHVNSTWFHIRNPFLLKITRSLFEKNSIDLLLISSIQKSFFNKFKGILGSVIDSEFFESLPQNALKKNYILFLGRVSVDKGIFDLINAYSIFTTHLKSNVIPKLLIVGPIESDSFHKELIFLIEELNLNEFVELVEPIYTIESKISLIDSCIFGVYPSYYDTFPLVMLEFAARKKPLIISNVSESKYFIESNDLLISPGDINSLSKKILNLYTENLEYKYSDIHFDKSQLYSSNNISKLFLKLI
jgi:glycosyltransferase involved in cell wall biosynthesis